MSTLLVIDIGGTSVKTGFVVDGAPHSYVRLFPSTQLRIPKPVDALARIVAVVLAEASLTPDSIVATVPGFLDSAGHRVLFAANVPELNGCALVQDLRHSTGIPVILERDVVLSLMGEYVAGACQQSPSVLGIFFGTGVGAAYLEAGRPFRGSGWALELGHMPYQGTRRWLGEERTACLEAFVSGKVLESIATEHAVHVGEVFTAALHNVALREHADDFVQNQANAVATAIAILSPKTVVLGGGICEMPDFPKDRLVAGIQSSFPFAETGQTLDLRWAHLGWKGVLQGAALLAGEKQLSQSSRRRSALAFMSGSTDQAPGTNLTQTDSKAMAVATALFFMVGFLTCLNDLIIPHLKSIFELTYAEAMLVQFAFFSAYFVFSFPAGVLVDKLGYKKTMVTGLLVMATGAACFLPAAHFASFPTFLFALIVLASGMTTVQVAVNPFVAIIGPPATAASRLNLTQAFSSVGTFTAPLLGAALILRNVNPVTPERLHSMSEVARQAYRAAQASTVRLPYIGLTLALVFLAIALAAVKLNTQNDAAQHTRDFRPGAYDASRVPSIWRQRWLLAGAIGIFTYVGAEVAIGSLLINYMGLPQIGGLREATAGRLLILYWGGAMVGRFAGSVLLRTIRTGWLLGPAAIIAFVLVIASVFSTGHLAMGFMLAVGLFNSIMFPSIFTLGLQGLGPLTSKGSSLMIAAIVGGALIPLAAGKLADIMGLQLAFLLPALCYAYVAAMGIAAIRRRPVLIPEPAHP